MPVCRNGHQGQQNQAERQEYGQNPNPKPEKAKLFLRGTLAPAAGMGLLGRGGVCAGGELNRGTGLHWVLLHIQQAFSAENLTFLNFTPTFQTVHIATPCVYDETIVQQFAPFVKRKVKQETRKKRGWVEKC